MRYSLQVTKVEDNPKYDAEEVERVRRYGQQMWDSQPHSATITTRVLDCMLTPDEFEVVRRALVAHWDTLSIPAQEPA